MTYLLTIRTSRALAAKTIGIRNESETSSAGSRVTECKKHLEDETGNTN
jgi:hypothetical protein